MAGTALRNSKKVGRKRRIAGWVMLAVGLGVMGVWGASRWWCFGDESERWTAWVERGSVYLEVRPAAYAGPRGRWNQAYTGGIDGVVRRSPAPSGWRWFPDTSVWFSRWESPPEIEFSAGVLVYRRRGTNHPGGDWYTRQCAVALWPLFPVLLAGGWWVLRSGIEARRRSMKGCCLACGYDLAGLGGAGACPECGKGRAA